MFHSVLWVIPIYGIMSSYKTPHPYLIALSLPLTTFSTAQEVLPFTRLRSHHTAYWRLYELIYSFSILWHLRKLLSPCPLTTLWLLEPTPIPFYPPGPPLIDSCKWGPIYCDLGYRGVERTRWVEAELARFSIILAWNKSSEAHCWFFWPVISCSVIMVLSATWPQETLAPPAVQKGPPQRNSTNSSTLKACNLFLPFTFFK